MAAAAWTAEDVARWVAAQEFSGAEDVAQLVRDEEVDGDTLLEYAGRDRKKELREDFRLTLGAANALWKAICVLSEGSDEAELAMRVSSLSSSWSYNIISIRPRESAPSSSSRTRKFPHPSTCTCCSDCSGPPTRGGWWHGPTKAGGGTRAPTQGPDLADTWSTPGGPQHPGAPP